MSLPYNGKLISRAKELRSNMTPEENKLWYQFLRKYPIRFQRQKTIDNYIADFYCSKAKLVIEVDGSQHYSEEAKEYDRIREEVLKSIGVKVIRFSNKDIRENFEEVCEMIKISILEGGVGIADGGSCLRTVPAELTEGVNKSYLGECIMITGEIKNKIDKIWTDIWAGGITQPLTVIEQLTYLMFIRSLDEKEIENESIEALGGKVSNKIFPQTPDGQAMRWSKFKDKDARDIFDIIGQKVFPFIKSMSSDKASAFSRYMEDAMFFIPTPQVLQKVITGLDELYEHDIKDRDMQGDLYEYMLGKLSVAGQNGQFRTPKHIRDMMVALLAPTPDDRICDPACGTAGFLVSSAEYIRQKYESKMTTEQWQKYEGDAFAGFDTDRTMLRISAMNLMLHSISNPHIDYADGVSKRNEISNTYSIILSNPPFTGTIDEESINDNLKVICNTKKTELLFVALFIRMLDMGGQCACIVPDGVLFGTTKAHKSLRQELIEKQNLRAIISMPSGVFKPYAGVSTAIVVFTKTNAGGTEKVWFYDMKSDGFSLDDKRTDLCNDGDITDIIKRFHTLENEKDRKRAEQSFLVDKEEIKGNDYDLSINRYKEIEYKKVEYEKPEVIMTRLDELAIDLSSKMEELRRLLGHE